MRKINDIVIHCSNTEENLKIDSDYIKRIHVTNYDFKDIGFHYVISQDGTVKNTLLESKNILTDEPNSISICYIGGRDINYHPCDTRTEEQKNAMASLIQKLLERYNLTINDVHCCTKCCSNLKI